MRCFTTAKYSPQRFSGKPTPSTACSTAYAASMPVIRANVDGFGGQRFLQSVDHRHLIDLESGRTQDGKSIGVAG